MSTDRTLQSIADVLAANEQHLLPRDPNRPELHWRDIAGLPTPRPVPSPEDRMRDATDTGPSFARPVGFASDIEQDERDALTTPTGRSFRTWMSDTDRDQLDARAACAEQERDDALDDRDQARAEAANLRKQLDAINTDRQRLQTELDTMTQVAQGNKRHVAYLTAVIEAIANVEPHIHNGDAGEDNCSPYCPGCRIRTAMNATPPASVPSRRMQEEPACTCYPSGFSPGTYEGPMRDCPVHGELSAEARP